MEVKSIECENCGAHIELIEGLNQTYCPYCGTKYVVSNSENQINDSYEYEEFVIGRSNEETMMHELSFFNYEYASSNPLDGSTTCLVLKVRRKHNFNHREEIVKLERDYHILRNRYKALDDTITFPSGLMVLAIFIMMLVPELIGLSLYKNTDINEGLLALIIISMAIAILICSIKLCKKIEKNRRLEIDKKLHEIIEQKNDIFKKIIEMNKSNNE